MCISELALHLMINKRTPSFKAPFLTTGQTRNSTAFGGSCVCQNPFRLFLIPFAQMLFCIIPRGLSVLVLQSYIRPTPRSTYKQLNNSWLSDSTCHHQWSQVERGCIIWSTCIIPHKSCMFYEAMTPHPLLLLTIVDARQCR